MSEKKMTIKPVAAALGVAFASAVAFSGTALAAGEQNPFAADDLDRGYMLAGDEGGEKGEEGKCGEGKAGEGKCGENKGEEGKCGEGKAGEGKCGENKGEEGKCGEGKCGEKKAEEGGEG